MSHTTQRPPRVEHLNSNFGPFKTGDTVIAVHSMTGHQGETGTIVAIDDSKRFCPLMVQFADGFKRLYSAAALRLADGGGT